MHQISGYGWQAEVCDLGAELQSFGAEGGPSLLWHGDAAHWAGRSPILFPIVGRAANDVLTVDGQAYTMAQHGFARRSIFQMVEKGADFVRHELRESEATLAQYPRHFCLSVEHRLTPQGLMIKATVRNTDERPLPFGLGFHPAFHWPLPAAEGATHHVQLSADLAPLRTPLSGGLLSADLAPSPFVDGTLTLDPSLFEQDALIFLDGAGSRLTYGPRSAPQIQFEFENLPFLALWTKPGAPFLCVEPWHGAAAWADASAALEDRPGTIVLPPSQSVSFKLSVTPNLKVP